MLSRALRHCALVLLAYVFAPTAYAVGPADTVVMRNVSYGNAPAEKLDLYVPPSPGLHKLAVFVHGGGWMKGDKGGGRLIAQSLLPAGYAVASVNYRMVPEVTVAGEAQDVAQSVAFLLSHAGQYGIDPAYFVLIGHSAGGHLVALLATDPRYLKAAGVDPERLAAVVPLDGVFDIARDMTEHPSQLNYGIFGNDSTGWNAVSPIVFAASMHTHPRFCLVHEDASRRFIEQESLFETTLRQRGETVQSLVAPGLSHVELLSGFPDPKQPMAAFTLSCLSRAMQ